MLLLTQTTLSCESAHQGFIRVMIARLGVFGLGKFLVYLRQFSWSHTRQFPLNWYKAYCRTCIALISFKCKCTLLPFAFQICFYITAFLSTAVWEQFARAVTQFRGVLKVFVHVVTVVLSVSVSQMAMGLNPCWRCLRTASPCHSPPSSQVSAGWRGSTATYRLFFFVAVLFWERELMAPLHTENFLPFNPFY